MDFNACTACSLSSEVKYVGLPAVGNPQSGLFIIADRPTYKEDDLGVSFSGQAGQFLSNMLVKAGLTSDDSYYMTYLVKCALPDTKNADKKKESLKACVPQWLEKEILEHKPKVILAFGADVMSALSGRTGIVKNRGVILDIEVAGHACKMIPTFSPAYLLQDKREFEDNVVYDIKRAVSLLAGNMPCWNEESLSKLDYKTINTNDDFKDFLDKIRISDAVACDIECRGKDAYKTFTDSAFPLVSIQFSTKEGTAWFLPIAHQVFVTEDNPKGLAWDISPGSMLHNGLTEVFNGNNFIIGHNFKFDSKFILKFLGIRVNLNFDTMLAAGLFEETSNSLKKAAWELTDMGGYEQAQQTYTESLPSESQYDMFYYPFDQLATYGCADADVTFRIFKILDERLRTDKTMLTVFKLLVNASMAFLDIENDGIRVDTSYLTTLGAELDIEANTLEAEFKKLAYRQIMEIEEDLVKAATGKSGKIMKSKPTLFNISSNVHVGTLFFEKLGIEPDDEFKSKKTGEYSIGRPFLNTIKNDWPIADKLLNYRKVSKQKSGFVEAYPQFIDTNGYIHPDYKLIKFFNEDSNSETGTVSGRLSCSNPNLQQVPSRGDGKRIKKLFIPDFEDHWLVDCLAPGTKILTSNFIWKNIEDLNIGENLVGFSEDLGKNIVFENSVIENIITQIVPRYKVITDKGIVICSGTHKWAAMKKYKKGYSKRKWFKTIDLKEGMCISFLKEPWETTNTFKDGWISGMLDGEGWCSKRGSSGIAQNKGIILDQLKSYLDEDFIEYKDWNKVSYKDCVHLNFTGSWAAMQIIGKYQSKRLLSKYKWCGIRAWNKNSEPATILKIEQVEDGPVVSMKTSSKTFIAEGLFSHNCDFAGIELRVAAMHSQDKAMKMFFNEGKGDFHRWVASQIYNKTEEEVTDAERTYAKSTTFGILYGAGPAKIAEQANMSERQAVKFIDQYFKLFPGLKKWIQQQKAFAERNLYVKSLFGRVRRLPNAGSRNEGQREAALRRAINSPIQYDASDITLHALTRIHKYLRDFNHADQTRPSRLRGSVHDSILLSVHDADLSTILSHIKFKILEAPTLTFILDRSILLRADIAIGKNWGAKESVEFDEN